MTLEDLYEEMKSCSACKLRAGCNQVVTGMGNAKDPVLLLCGEAPGQEEDMAGEPFVGRSGQLLREVIRETGILNKRNTLVSNTLKCLHRQTPIVTEEGNKQLGWIVVNKWKGKVKSVDGSGNLCWKEIKGWYRSKLDGRRLYRISFKNGKGNCKGPPGVTVTEDHLFLTLRGWIPAKDLANNDMVATGTPFPGPRARQLLLASMCGDAKVGKGQYSECHSIKQEQYLLFKSHLLSGYSPSYDLRRVVKTRGKSYFRSSFSLKKSFLFNDMSRQWYLKESKYKTFPKGVIQQLDDFGLAIWYMDDGYWRRKTGRKKKKRIATDCEIALGSISENVAFEVAKGMKAHGLNCYAKHRTTWRLIFRYGEPEKFFPRVARFFPSCMRYKLPEEFRDVDFDYVAFDPEPVRTDWRNIEVTNIKPDTYKFYFCIDVEDTGCFVTPGGVVHNCRPPKNKFPTDETPSICVSKWLDKEIELAKPARMLLVGGQALKHVAGKKGITACRGQWYDVKGIRTMATFHPSYVLRQEGEGKNQFRSILERDVGEVALEVADIEKEREGGS